MYIVLKGAYNVLCSHIESPTERIACLTWFSQVKCIQNYTPSECNVRENLEILWRIIAYWSLWQLGILMTHTHLNNSNALLNNNYSFAQCSMTRCWTIQCSLSAQSRRSWQRHSGNLVSGTSYGRLCRGEAGEELTRHEYECDYACSPKITPQESLIVNINPHRSVLILWDV